MWTIRFCDSNTRYIVLVREALFDGAVLYSKTEETILRLCRKLTVVTQERLGVRCEPYKYMSDPKKERFYEVKPTTIDIVYESLLSILNH
ncbi:MAG TPA: hypothetical protein P5064_07840 [Clostridia bacterium]|jgi:hypothetical protein|nr:hypothetical protein [Clostridiaceae bacterium]HOF26587.1 hypothetical protein [Clostridia bacterium]HOM34280.1 hypothetical protein [Clostridia bacterium]HOR89415.1 hypothetical protein [Clostridia bacterium]HOT70776.1 hypothetical protein [Clostridia bacterium]